MFKINLQLFGGRGSLSSGKTKKAVIPFEKFTSKQIRLMNRSQLATIARAVYINKNTSSSISASTAARRFDLLLDGNTTAQLRKYILKHQ